MYKLRMALCAAVFFGLILGCGAGAAPRAKVRGTVKYNGKPLMGGNIIFHAEGGSRSTSIAQDGTGHYEATDVPTGQVDVTVDTEFLKPPAQVTAAQKERAAASAKIDAKYAAGMAAVKGASGGGAPVSAEELAKRYTKIPAKYGKPGTSGLGVTLTSGWNDKDFDLTD
jgi:hypothetical protein